MIDFWNSFITCEQFVPSSVFMSDRTDHKYKFTKQLESKTFSWLASGIQLLDGIFVIYAMYIWKICVRAHVVFTLHIKANNIKSFHTNRLPAPYGVAPYIIIMANSRLVIQSL